MSTAVVSGGSRGIGRAICLDLAKNGYNIAFNYIENDIAAEKTVFCLKKISRFINIKKYKCDVADNDAIESMVSDIKDTMGNISLLVNNAGIAKHQLFQDISPADWKRILDVNLNGTYNLIHSVLPDMISKKSGCIINIASVWGITGGAMETHYSASKGAIIALTKALAKEIGPSNIRVNAVAPGPIKTDMLSAIKEEDLIMVAGEMPLQRLGTPEEIAATVSFLASDSASFITGQVISPNGGFTI